MNATPEQLREQLRDLEEKAEARLMAAKRIARRAEIQRAVAKARFNETIRETKDILSRRRAAELAGLTAGRIQQIADSPPSDVDSVDADYDPDVGFAELLRERRLDLGMSLASVSNATGLSTRAISKLETGESIPPISKLQAYANALGGRVRLDFEPFL